MTFRLIEAEKAQHPVSRLCSVLGVTRAGYYAWRERGPSSRARGDAELAPLIGRIFVESLETYSAPRVHAELREAHGIRVGRKRVARLMRQLELEGVSRRGKRRRATIPDPAAAPAPDLVGRRFTAARPNDLWRAAITYLPTPEGSLFLAVVLDVYSRRIVGWSMRDDLETELVVDALGMRSPGASRRWASSTTPSAARRNRYVADRRSPFPGNDERYVFRHAAQGATRSPRSVCRAGRNSPAHAGRLNRRHPLRRHRVRKGHGLPATPNGPPAATGPQWAGTGGGVDPRRRLSLRLATPRPGDRAGLSGVDRARRRCCSGGIPLQRRSPLPSMPS